MVEPRSVSLSVVLHIGLLLIAAFGLPALLPKNPDPVPMVMSVELLPLAETSNVKPSDQQIQKEQKAPTPKPVAKPMPPAAEEKPTPPTPAPPKPAEKTFDPDEGAEAPDKIKPVEKEKPKEEPKQNNEDFNKLLRNLQQEAKTAPTKDAKDKTNTPENKTKSDVPYDDSMPLSISEKDMIRSQFIPCWTMPAGAMNATSLAVRVKVQVQQDGTVMTAAIASDQMGRYNSDPFFRAAADSAVRAVHKCSPLKNLPADKYGSWREMELNFDPKDLM